MAEISSWFSNLSLDTVFYNNTVSDYLIALGILAVALALAVLASRGVAALTGRIAARIRNKTLADVLRGEGKLHPLIFYIPFPVAAHYLALPAVATAFIGKLGVAVVALCAVRYLVDIGKALSRQYMRNSGANPMIGRNLDLIVAAVIYGLGILFVLSNLGFNINTLLAGLGIGGMAVALASQTLLADLFNYFTIIVDKPFSLGDSVSVNGYSGNVESIGLKGTRIRSYDGELIIISNTDMTKNALRNFQIMGQRRVITKLGVTYDTAKETVALIPAMLENIVRNTPDTRFGRAHFASFGDSALNFELVYYVLSGEYGVYMDAVQRVNLSILDEFDKNQINFAFPSQDIYLRSGAINVHSDNGGKI